MGTERFQERLKMYRISFLVFCFLLCVVFVTAEESGEKDLVNTNNELHSLKRHIRNPNANPEKRRKKSVKKRKSNRRKKKSKTPKNKRKSVKVNGNSKSDKKRKSGNARKQLRKSKNRKKSGGKRKEKRKGNKNKPKIIKESKKKGNRNKSKIIRKTKGTRTSKPRKCTRQNGANDNKCLENIGTAMDYEGIQVKNFNQQKSRLGTFDKLVKNKGGKKGNFANSTSYLNDALGSDKSCNGTTNKTDQDAAKETHTTLSNCETSINDGCTIPNGTYDSSVLETCATDLGKVTTKNKQCYTLTTKNNPDLSKACDCWQEAADLVTETKALKCSAKSSLDEVTTIKRACLKKFSACKKAEDS